MTESNKKHVEYQTKYFDDNYEFFRQDIPQDVVERTKEIVAAANLGADSRVLDVGTGMGVLIPHFRRHGVDAKNIVGCDLSTQMLTEARRRHEHVTFWQGDFAELPADYGDFDAIFFNACFGNLFDADAVVANAVRRLKPGGRLVISHPMGNRFVLQLKNSDPNLVLSPLPSAEQLQKWCTALGLSLQELRDEQDLYIAVLKR